MRQFISILTLLAAILLNSNVSAEVPTIRVGVLKFGTVNWELQTIKKQGFDLAEGFNLEIVPYAGKTATATALHGGAVDAIVNDWIWVSRQRSEGRMYSFIPYSRMNGALMVSSQSGIDSLQSLAGKRVGVAGGPVDKNWLLIQALAKKENNTDLGNTIKSIFGAPPLLSKKMERGELDAVVTFWHYAAKLEAGGATRLLDISEVLDKLGMSDQVPMIGYVFTPEISQHNETLIQAFDRASRKAKSLLLSQNQAWEPLKPLMRVKSNEGFLLLQSGFRAGLPRTWGSKEREEAKKLYRLLADLGGKKLVGRSSDLNSGTFIESVRY